MTNKKIFCLLLVLFSLGQCFAQKFKLSDAIELFNKGKYEESKKIFNTINSGNKEYGEACFYLGKICHFTKNYDEAIEYFKKAIATNNENADYYFWLGNSYGEKAMLASMVKKPFLAKKILEVWGIAAKLDSTHLGVRWGLMNFYSQAPAMFGGGMNKAYKVCEEIKKINYADGFESKGYVYERDNKKDMAEWSHKEAIKASPDNMKYYYALAFFYMRQNKNEKSKEIFEKIIAVKPDVPYAYLEIGHINSTSGKDLDKGKDYLNHYIEIADKNNKRDLGRAYYYLGTIYKLQGNKVIAKKYYNDALSFDPSLKEAKQALDKL